jgi:2-iminobutanoate/2-iminopropanoate deaminase
LKKDHRKAFIVAKYVIQSQRGEPPQGAYSQGWRAGDFIFLPGTGPVDAVTGEIVGDTIEQQTEKTIDNIAATLEADGASLGDVVKVTAYLSDPGLFDRYNTAYARCFSPPYPVRTTVGSNLGMSPGMMVEIDCIAYKARGTGKNRSRRVRGRSSRRK